MKDKLLPKLVVLTTALVACSSPVASPEQVVVTVQAGLDQRQAEFCGGSLTAASDPLCTGTNPINPDSVDPKKAVAGAQKDQVKFKDGGFQMGELHPAIRALIENAPEIVRYFQAASYSLIDEKGGFVLNADKQIASTAIEPNVIPVLQKVDYHQIAENLTPDADGARTFDVMIGSGRWIYFDARNSDKLTIGYDSEYAKKLTGGLNFPIGQDQDEGSISHVMLIGKWFDVSEVARIAEVNNLKMGTAYVISPVPETPTWQEAVYDALDRRILGKVVVVTSNVTQYRHPTESFERLSPPGEYIIADKYVLNRKRLRVDEHFSVGSDFFGPAEGNARHGENMVWWTEITRKK